MKRHLIISGLLFIFSISQVMAYTTYTRYYPTYGRTTLPNGLIYRPTYNAYGQYYNPYQYRRYNSNNLQRLQRLQKMRLMNRIRRNIYNNFLTWNNNKNKNGTLSGYSVPISEDIYKELGISPNNQKGQKIKQNSPSCNTDLFSAPTGDEMYYNDGRFYKNLGGASGKTGVTIIYD